LAGVLAPVPGRFGWTIRLDPAGKVGDKTLALAFWLETRVAAGEVRIELPEDALFPGGGPARWDPATRARLARVPITAAVEIAVTELHAREIMTVVPGDAVVFEAGSAAGFLPDDRWPGRLAIRTAVARYQAPVAIDLRGEVQVVGVMSPTYEEGRMDTSDSGSGFDAVTVLAGVPVEVVAELGRITLRGEELLGLAPGAVLRLSAGRRTVSLRAGGELWAEGEIVDVEGELGVRVTRVLRR
jgi:type III secretion system YscQ/HrcQ family protein